MRRAKAPIASLVVLMACSASPRPATEAAPEPAEASEAPVPADAGVLVPDARAARVADAAPVAVAVEPPPPPERVPATGCLRPDDPAIAQVQAAAEAWTRASFDAELARRGLVMARLGSRSLTLHRGIRGDSPRSNGFPAGQIVETAVDGLAGRYLAGGVSWSGNARQPEPWELLLDGNGDVHVLRRHPLPSAESKQAVICGCAPRVCGPYGSGCPACGVTYQLMYGPLPPKAKYRGELTVRYEAATVSLRHEQAQCPAPRRCPAPPPSMPQR